MRSYIVYILLFLFLLQLKLNAQINVEGKPFFTHYNREYSFHKNLILRPQKVSILKRKYLVMLTAAGFAGYGIHKWDATIDRKYAFKDHGFPGSILQKYGELGKWYDSKKLLFTAGVTSLIPWWLARKNGNVKRQKSIEVVYKSFLVSTIATATLKILIGRSRPYTGDGPYEFETFDFYLKSRSWSFPSGHTSSVFAIMTAVAKQSDAKFVQGAAWFAAGSVGFQRMLHRKHWASDVLAGAFLGYLSASWVLNQYSIATEKIIINPYPAPNRLGIKITF